MAPQLTRISLGTPVKRHVLLAISAVLATGACARRNALDDFREGGYIDCAYEAKIQTWLDRDGDGQWSTDEPVLSDVALVVTNTSSQRRYPMRTDSAGTGTFSLMFAGCDQKYVVEAIPPEGFELTTRSQRVAADYVRYVTFGFVRRGA